MEEKGNKIKGTNNVYFLLFLKGTVKNKKKLNQ
jgi:hypothetical protein